jgi:hypothetical protein
MAIAGGVRRFRQRPRQLGTLGRTHVMELRRQLPQRLGRCGQGFSIAGGGGSPLLGGHRVCQRMIELCHRALADGME